MMKAAEKSLLYRELAKMIHAGFHLDRSLSLLLSQKITDTRRRFLSGLQQGLAEGMSLAESVRHHNRSWVTDLEVVIIEAGERSGQLSQAFQHLARYYELEDKTTRQMRGAMLYPLILLHLAILLPEIPAAIAQGDSASFLARVGGMMLGLWLLLLGGSWVWKTMNASARCNASLDALLSRLPWLGSARRHWALARFCQVFHAGLLAGIRVSLVCKMAGEASQSGLLSSAAQQAAELIETGERLAVSLADSGGFDVLFINAIATAEEVGKIDDEMERWAELESANAARSLELASLWIPKLGYVVIAGFVVYRIWTMMRGYYGNMLQLMENL